MVVELMRTVLTVASRFQTVRLNPVPAPRLDQGPTSTCSTPCGRTAPGVHDELADAPKRLRGLRDALRVLAAERTADPRPVAEGQQAHVADADAP